MSKTEVSGKQIKDGSIELVDLSSAVANDINTLKSDVATLQTDVAAKADAGTLASVATSGSYNDLADKPTIPSVDGLATETYVDTAVSGLVNSAPATLDTLKELSDALGADANFATTVAGQIGDVAADVTTLEGRVDALEISSNAVPNLADLGGVSITSPSADQVLKYDGLGWVNATAPSGGASDLDGLSDVAITSAAKGHFIAHNGTQFVNTRTIEADATTTVPLTVSGLVGAASHTANVFEAKGNDGTAYVTMNVDTSFATAGQTAALFAQAPNNNRKALIARASGAPNFSTFEVQNNAGSTVMTVNHVGTIGLPAWNISGASFFNIATSAGTSLFSMSGNGQVGLNYGTTFDESAQLNIVTRSSQANRKGISVKYGGAGPTAGEAFGYELLNSAGTRLFGVGTTGDITAATTATISGLKVGTNGVSTSTVFAADTATAMTGADNTFIGYQAGKGTTSGYANVVVGSQAYNNASSATGYQNICIGTYAGNVANAKNQMIIIGTAAQARGGRTLGIAIGHVAEAGTRAVALGQGAIANDNTLEIKWGGSSPSTFAGKITGDTAGVVSVTGDFHARRYTETVANAFNTSLAPASGTLTVDTSLGNAVLGALSASVTTWAFTNVPTDNSKVTTVTAVLAGNAAYTYGDACSVNGSAVSGGIMWSGGSAPTATSNTDIITFIIVRDSAGTVKVFGSATTNFS